MAWYGTVGSLCLVGVAVVAFLLQSISLFLFIVTLFIALVPIVGTAFFLLSLIVLSDAAGSTPRDSGRMRRLEAVPRIGPLWVRGFRRYYEEVIRPTLSDGRP